jgi:alkylation response protein AidB-like acyl-CoA dehydrogenase
MELALSDDQVQILDAIDTLAKPYASVPIHDISFALSSAELDRELAEGGFLDVAAMEELGPETAALVVERLARLPFAVEAAASALVRPLLDPELPRPLCLIEDGAVGLAVRYLAPGATVVVVGAGSVRSFTATAEHVATAHDESIFAYPMAVLAALPAEADMRQYGVSASAVLTQWRIGLAAEASGLMAAALAATVTYTTERKQFGRPIATFQALRHRLAEAQVVINGAYWMTMKAAVSQDPGDAALAALHAQEAARRVTYDFHQFLGAMGMTLEHPLHLWTYRLKALTSELGGRGANALAAAEAIWG